MTEQGWREAIFRASRDAILGDMKLLDLLVGLLREQDEAKQRLRELGFGCIGTPWPEVVNEVEERHTSS